VSRYRKGKINLDFTEARDNEWQWHQLGHMQVCNSLQTDNRASTQPLSFLQAGCPFLPPNQQHQSTEGTPTSVTTLIYASYTSHGCIEVGLTINLGLQTLGFLAGPVTGNRLQVTINNVMTEKK